MSSRFTLRNPRALAEAMARLGLRNPPLVTARFNAAPLQILPMLHERDGGLLARTLRWGIARTSARRDLRPQLVVNARAETALRQRAFKPGLNARRCLIPADGYFEWTRQPVESSPFFVRRVDDAPFWLAGFFDEKEGPFPAAFALLTTGANALLAPVHERMPVILSDNGAHAWLEPGDLTPDVMTVLCAPAPDDALLAYAVGQRVNDARNDGPECVRALNPAEIPPIQVALPLDFS